MRAIVGDCPQARSGRQSGFTLVEMLVVLFIIGLVAAIAALTIPDSRSGLVGEAERFAARLVAARDNAILQSRPMAVTIDAGGYAFQQRRAGEWTAMASGPFARTDWREGTRAELAQLASRSPPQLPPGTPNASAMPPHLVFDAIGLADSDLSFRLVNGSDAVSIAIDRGGAVRVGE